MKLAILIIVTLALTGCGVTTGTTGKDGRYDQVTITF